MFRATMAQVCQTYALERAWSGCKWVCTCSRFAKGGACPHVELTRWLEGDPAISLATLDQFVEKDAATSISQADDRLQHEKGAGRHCQMPAKFAWTTMQAIRAQVTKQAESRKRKADERKEALMESVQKRAITSSETEAPVLHGQQRDVQFGKLGKNFSADALEISVLF